MSDIPNGVLQGLDDVALDNNFAGPVVDREFDGENSAIPKVTLLGRAKIPENLPFVGPSNLPSEIDLADDNDEIDIDSNGDTVLPVVTLHGRETIPQHVPFVGPVNNQTQNLFSINNLLFVTALILLL